MNGITNFTSVSGNISPHGEVFGGGGGAPADDEDVEMVQPRSSVRIPLELYTVIAGFVPREIAGLSRELTVIDPNAKLDMLKKVKDLNVFSYLQGKLLPKINAQNLNFDFIKLINRLFKRVCTDVASLDSMRSNRESTIQDVYGVLQGTNTGQIIREGKDRSLQRFAEVLREGEHALAIPADLTPQQIRAWFADDANQGVLGGITDLDLSGEGLRHLPDEIGRFRNLEFLNLSNNPLSSVPDSIASLPRLWYLNLQNIRHTYLSDSIRNWFLAKVSKDGMHLRYASAELRADREVVLAAVGQTLWAFEYAAAALKADKEVVFVAVRQNSGALQYAAAELKADRDFVLAVVGQTGWALYYAADALKADREVVFAAVSADGRALQYAAAELKADREVVFAAVSQKGGALQYAAAELQADRDVVLAAVGQTGWALEYAAAELRADRDVVLAAVRKNGWALRYAAAELKADREVVLAAVTQNGRALEYAAAELQADPEIRAAAGLVQSEVGQVVILPGVNQNGRIRNCTARVLRVIRGWFTHQ